MVAYASATRTKEGEVGQKVYLLESLCEGDPRIKDERR
jgi:hypothetical protein